MTEQHGVPPNKLRILKYPDGQAPAQSTQVLKALFDRVVSDCGITKERWHALANAYLNAKAAEEGIGSAVNLVEARSGLNKDFGTQLTMTWRKFCEAMRFLRLRRFKLALIAEHASGRYTEHGIWITVNKDLVADPELDDEAAVPVEVEISDAQPIQQTARSHVPPPDLNKYGGNYPPAPNPRRDYHGNNLGRGNEPKGSA